MSASCNVSLRQATRLTDRFTFVVDGLASAVRHAAAVADERDVVVMGGAATVRGALEEGLLDELKLHISPVILGSGIPLFEGPVPQTDLALTEVKTYPNGFMLAKYSVGR